MHRRHNKHNGGVRGGTSSNQNENGPSRNSRSVRISKSLSWLLRHGAPEENVKLYPGGFVALGDILQHLRVKSKLEVTEDEIKDIVASNDKQRFTIKTDEETGELRIRANQGHSFPVEDLELEAITDPSQFPTVIHGTYLRFWNSIKSKGLSRMNRTHIHFAPGELGDKIVISGLRNSAELHIYIDLQKALQDSLKFCLSTNNVILCQGNDQGILELKYFSKVINVKSGQPMPLDGQ